MTNLTKNTPVFSYPHLQTTTENTQKIVEIASTNISTTPPVDMTKILLQNPDGILAWAFSITLVLSAIGGVMQIIKPSPQHLAAFGKSISEIIDAVIKLIQSLNSQDKDNQ